MAAFRRIHTSGFMMLLLHFIGAATGQSSISFAVRDGENATLSCNDRTDDPNSCDTTTWVYKDSSRGQQVELVGAGQVIEKATVKSDRLRVTEKCSLVIKKVTKEDAGYYGCSNIRSGPQYGVFLFVVIMTEEKHSEQVRLTCSVTSRDHCSHTVTWLFNGKNVDGGNKELQTSQSDCSASVSFRTSHYISSSRNQLLTCEVADGSVGSAPQQFPFRLSGEDPTAAATESPPTRGNNSEAGNTWTGWRWYVVLAVVLAALLIITVVVIIWMRRKGNAQMNNSVALTSNPAASQLAPEDMAEPEVSYVSVSYTRNSSAAAQVCSEAAEGDAVTYTTVKASPADPSSLYAAVRHSRPLT